MSQEEGRRTFPLLKDSVEIRKTPHVCVARDAYAPTAVGRSVTPLEAVVMALCDGTRDACAIARCLPTRLFQAEGSAEEFVATTLRRYDALFTQLGVPGDGGGRFDPAEFLYVPAKPSQTGRYRSPVRASFLLTYRCNFRCVYCYNGSGPEQRDYVSTQTWVEAIRQLSQETDCQSIFLCGGEPLIHPGFFDIFKAGRDAGMFMDVTTNGSLVDEYAAKRLADLGMRYILVSLDTPVANEHHALTRSKDTFGKVTHAIELLSDAGINVHVKGLLHDGNYRQVPQLAALVRDLGATGLTLSAYDATNMGRGRDALALSDEHLKEVQDLEPAMREGLEFFDAYRTVHDWCGEGDYAQCGAWCHSIEIGPTGAYNLCETLAGDSFFDLGSFPQTSIMDAWNSPRVDEILHPDPALCDPACRACAFFKQCRTGCFKNKLTCGVGHYDRDPFCKLPASLRYPK